MVFKQQLQNKYKTAQQAKPALEDILRSHEDQVFNKWSSMVIKNKDQKDYLVKSKKEVKERQKMDQVKFQEKLDKAKVYRRDEQ